MADGAFSVWIGVGLMLFIWAFGQLMIEAKPQKCPWERDEAMVPDNTNFEARSRKDWKDFKPAFAAEDLHRAHQ